MKSRVEAALRDAHACQSNSSGACHVLQSGTSQERFAFILSNANVICRSGTAVPISPTPTHKQTSSHHLTRLGIRKQHKLVHILIEQQRLEPGKL